MGKKDKSSKPRDNEEAEMIENIRKHLAKKKGRKLSGTWIGDPDDDEKKA